MVAAVRGSLAADDQGVEMAAQLAAMKDEVRRRMDEARVSAEKEKDLLISEARRSAGIIVESARKEIESQKLEAARHLQNKVAELSLMAAERIMMKQLDHRANTDLASKYLAELEKSRPDLKLECE